MYKNEALSSLLIVDVDECEMIAGACENGKCMDTADSYMCMCNPGFKLSMDGKKCTGMLLSKIHCYLVEEIQASPFLLFSAFLSIFFGNFM